MRGDDDDAAAGRDQAVKLLHGADDVGEVLDDVDGAQLASNELSRNG